MWFFFWFVLFNLVPYCTVTKVVEFWGQGSSGSRFLIKKTVRKVPKSEFQVNFQSQKSSESNMNYFFKSENISEGELFKKIWIHTQYIGRVIKNLWVRNCFPSTLKICIALKWPLRKLCAFPKIAPYLLAFLRPLFIFFFANCTLWQKHRGRRLDHSFMK